MANKKLVGLNKLFKALTVLSSELDEDKRVLISVKDISILLEYIKVLETAVAESENTIDYYENKIRNLEDRIRELMPDSLYSVDTYKDIVGD